MGVSTDNAINAVRVAIVKDEIDCKDVQFKFNSETFHTNEYGRIADWPNGFCEIGTKLLEDLLRGAMEKRAMVQNTLKSKDLAEQK